MDMAGEPALAAAGSSRFAMLNVVAAVSAAVETKEPAAIGRAALSSLFVLLAVAAVVNAVRGFLAWLRVARPWSRLRPAPSGAWDPLTGNAMEMVKGIYG